MAATGRSWTPRASVCSVLRVSNHVIEFSQQDTNKRITGVMISDFTFKPRDSISLQFPPLYHGARWQFIIPATKSICSTPSVRLSVHPQTGNVHHRASMEKTKNCRYHGGEAGGGGASGWRSGSTRHVFFFPFQLKQTAGWVYNISLII